jgi:putative ABC transport system substrate-binding protein
LPCDPSRRRSCACNRGDDRFVASLARPGGNTTGFASLDYGTSGKWLALLKEIAPRVTRAAILRDPTIAAGIGQLAGFDNT